MEVEMALEVEDDVFFADLSKQISLLIMDDDEQFPVVQCPSVAFQAFSHSSHPIAQPPFMYEQVYRREIRGTGVFIPRSSLPRKKNRSGRSRQADKPRGSAISCATTAINSQQSFINGHRSYSSVLKKQS